VRLWDRQLEWVRQRPEVYHQLEVHHSQRKLEAPL
jgi:hypothetical protein